MSPQEKDLETEITSKEVAKSPVVEKQDDEVTTELKPATTQRNITFLPDVRRGRSETPYDAAFGGSNRRRSRSISHDSISSVRSRARSVQGVPIEFRSLSFNVSESQAVGDKPRAVEPSKISSSRFPWKKEKKAKPMQDDKDHDYFANIDAHTIDEAALCSKLDVNSEKGLTSAEVETRLARDGPNSFKGRRENYPKKIFFYVFGGFCSILWIGVIIFFICWRPLGDPDPQPYNLGLAILVLIVIFLQASFSAFQDWSTARTMKSILNLLPADTIAIRNGEAQKVGSTSLVAGDIVKISIGNKVPADVRLISTSGDVRFDRSMLTGESEEVEGSVKSTDKNFLETRNVALMGTMVTNGSATGVVVLTGPNTVMGRIANATNSIEDQPTHIQREINRFVLIIVGLTALLALAILLTWVGWIRVDHFAFMNVVAMLNDVMGCVVAFIPEGMPVGVALTLLLVARRMRSNNILPKGLSTVETLGCVNVLCSDKTGTLTENKMSVTTVAFVDARMPATDALDVLTSEARSSESLETLLRASSLCNDATFDVLTLDQPIAERGIQGNATDGAVLKFAELARPEMNNIAIDSPRAFQIAFNSKNKWMMTLHKEDKAAEQASDAAPSFLILVKGAPDVLRPYCRSYWSHSSNSAQPFDEKAQAAFAAQQEALSRNGERVIILCERHITPTARVGTNAFAEEMQSSGMQDLTIIGLLGITDLPRKETAATVAACRRAGIRFFMVTGDFGLTAAAIARSVGIFTNEADPDTIQTVREQHNFSDSDTPSEKKVQADVSLCSRTSLLLEGPSISTLTLADWNVVCSYEEIVFARTTPEQKLKIVNEFKARGNAVAVTGDGVNDAPALRAADVGVAVVTGSDVALEAADLVLLDKFDAIIDAIRLGRLVFQNLQKVIAYLLPAGSWSEIWPVILNVYFGVPLPLSSFLMIIICVFTDLFCSLSLIMEKEEFDLLELPPRNHKKDHLINFKIYAQSYLFIGIMETLIAHSMFFYYMYKHAGIPVHALFFAFEKYSDGFYGYTEAELTYFNTVGQCVYFVTLVILQWGNILSVRNKRLSILQADPIRKQRRNPWIFAGMIISLSIAVFVTEEPGIQSIFGTASVPIEFWLIPLPLALGILFMDELRKLAVRTWPKGPIAKVAW